MDKARLSASLYILYITLGLLIGGAVLVSVLPLMPVVILVNEIGVWGIWLFLTIVSMALIISSIWLIAGAFFENILLRRKLEALKRED